jgi:ribosomal protein L7/L12
MSAFSEDTAYASILILLVGFFVLWVSWLVTGIEMRGRLSRLDFKLDLLLKHAGVEYDPYKNLPRDVVDALRRSQKIQAIQRYRKVTGVGLKEAKDFIEDVQRRSGDAS